MDQILDQLRPLLDLLSRHAWVPAAALVIGLLARAAKEPAVGSLFARVPRQHRPRVVLALGVVSGVLDAIVRGTPAGTAIAYGVISAALAVLGHGALGGTSPESAAPPAKGELPGGPGVQLPSAANVPPVALYEMSEPLAAAPPLTPETHGEPAPMDLDFNDPKPSTGGAS